MVFGYTSKEPLINLPSRMKSKATGTQKAIYIIEIGELSTGLAQQYRPSSYSLAQAINQRFPHNVFCQTVDYVPADA
jgi:hypothetical protein